MRKLLKLLLTLLHAASFGPLLFFVPPIISEIVHPQVDGGFIFLFALPFMLGAVVAMFIDGIILLNKVLRKSKKESKKRRILLGVAAILLLAPGLYASFMAAWYGLTAFNADRVMSDQEALALVQNCKVASLDRTLNYAYEANAPNGMAVKIYLKESAESAGDKAWPLWSYRTFNLAYYDKLFSIAQSQQIRSKCGYIKFNDAERTQLPATYEWTSVDEAEHEMDTCTINEIYTKAPPTSDYPDKVRGTQTEIFMVLLPNENGTFGRLYISNASQQTSDEILNFAKKKQPVCVYHLPNILPGV